MKKRFKKIIVKIKLNGSKQKRIAASALALIIVATVAISLSNYLKPSHAASSTELSLSPTSQTVTTGSDLVVTVEYTPGGSSVNTIQSVFNYSSTDFTLVSIVGGSSFGSFVDTPSTGSISFTAANTTAITTAVAVATITLQATGVGSSAASLASVCAAGNYAITCSAAYDSVTSNNDLGSVAGATYVVSPTIPSTPTLSTTANTPTSISLSWTASTDATSPVAGYAIYENNAGTGTALATTSGTTYTVTGLTANTAYAFTVEAYDSESTPVYSVVSNSISFTVPTAPSGLASSVNTYGYDATFNSVTFSWTASSDSGPGIGGYAIYENSTGTGTPLATVSASTTSYTATGLTQNTSYTFTVKAYDTSSTPVYSGISNVLTTSTYQVGDIDGNLSGSNPDVEAHDLSLIIAHYNTNWAPAEFDGTANVEGHDLSLLIDNYGM